MLPAEGLGAAESLRGHEADAGTLCRICASRRGRTVHRNA
nr:MAG TPA: hypothetical protein [Caudoviricetes sp.]